MSSTAPDGRPEASSPIAPLETADQGKRLVELIEFEIERLRDEEARQGWTVRAGFGALGAIGWLLLSEVGGSPTTQDLSRWMVIAATLLTATRFVLTVGRLFVLDSDSRETRAEVLALPDLLTSSRQDFFVNAVRAVVLVSVVSIWRFAQQWWVVWPIRVLLGLEALLSVFMLAVSYMVGRASFEARYTTADRIGRVTPKSLAAGVTVNGIYVGLLVAPLATGEISTSLTDWKMGALLFAGAFVGELIARRRASPPLQRALMTIRRDIGLGLVDCDSARERTRIALIGLSAGDVLQREVAEQIERLGRMQRKSQAANEKLRVLADMVRGVGRSASGASLVAARALLDSVALDYRAVMEENERFQKESDEFSKHAQYLWRICPEARDTLTALVERASEAVRTSLSSASDTRRELTEVRAAIEGVDG